MSEQNRSLVNGSQFGLILIFYREHRTTFWKAYIVKVSLKSDWKNFVWL